MNHPCREYPAFCKWLLSVPKEVAIAHLVECFTSQGEMAYSLADYYQEFNPEKLLERLWKDAKTEFTAQELEEAKIRGEE